MKLHTSLLLTIAGSLFVATLSASLTSNSPFLPPGFVPPSDAAPVRPPTNNQEVRQLEFRGVYELDDQMHVHIFNRRDNRGSWVKLNDSEASFAVEEFDRDTNSIVLKIDGETTRLNLVTTSDRSIPVQTAPQQVTPSQPPATEPGPQPIRRRPVASPNRTPTGQRPALPVPRPATAPGTQPSSEDRPAAPPRPRRVSVPGPQN